VREASEIPRDWTNRLSQAVWVRDGPGWALVGEAGYSKDPRLIADSAIAMPT
jgi:hypothetical protein